MCSLLMGLAVDLVWVPLIFIPIIAVLSVGMMSVYLSGYRGKEINSGMLFTGFNDFKRIAGGMMWMQLWTLIWGFVPIMNIIKTYSYMFVPYILLKQPDINATDALKRSMEMTNGYKMKIFLAQLLIFVIIGVIGGVFAGLAVGLAFIHPIIGVIFTLPLFAIALIVALFLPLFMGLLGVAFYDEIENLGK